MLKQNLPKIGGQYVTSPEPILRAHGTLSSMLHHPVLETKHQQQQRQTNMSNTSATKFNSTGLKTHHRTYSSNPFHAVPNQESQLTLMANCYNTAGSGGGQEGTKAKSPRKRKYKRRRNKHYMKQ